MTAASPADQYASLFVQPSIAVTATDQQIDVLVYDLYGLTAQERELVEASQPSAKASAPAKARREAKPEKQAELL